MRARGNNQHVGRAEAGSAEATDWAYFDGHMPLRTLVHDDGLTDMDFKDAENGQKKTNSGWHFIMAYYE